MKVSLASLPDDVKLKVLEHLDVQDARSLSIMHTSWTVPARTIIFRRIETVKRGTASLGHLVESILPTIGGSVRRLGLSFAWSAVSGHIPSAAQMDDWLLHRDTYFSEILGQATGLRILRVRFQYEYPHAEATMEAQLERSTLTRTAGALCKRDRLETLQLDFNMPGRPYGLQSAILLPVIFADILTQSGIFPNLTTLSLANITVAGESDRAHSTTTVNVFDSFCSFVQSLPSLTHLQLDNFICPPSSLRHIISPSIRSFELLDDFRHFNALEVFQALADKPNLRRFRFRAHERNFSSLSQSHTSFSNPSAATPGILLLRSLCLECPGKYIQRWLNDLVPFLKRSRLQFPNLHTICFNIKLTPVSNDFDAKPWAQALSNKADFPRLQALQLPQENLWQADFVWGSVLSSTLEKSGIELQFSESAARDFKRFMSAVQEVE